MIGLRFDVLRPLGFFAPPLPVPVAFLLFMA